MHFTGCNILHINGLNLTYLDRPAATPTTAPPLLLLHGIVSSAEGFATLIAGLPDNRRIVALNLPGIPTGDTLPDVTLLGLATLVRDIAQHLGLDRPIVLGHSHGGLIAIQLAASFPDAISGLILLAPAHPYLKRERLLVAFYNSWLGNRIAHSFRLLPVPLHNIGINRLLGPVGRKAAIDFRPYRTALFDRATVTEVLRSLRTWVPDMESLGHQLEATPISTPTVFLWGDHDPIVPLNTAERLLEHFRYWEMFTLPGVGHLPNDEDPARCIALIKTWLIWLQTGRLANVRK